MFIKLKLTAIGFCSNIFQFPCKATKINSLVSCYNWMCLIFTSILISTEALEQASMFVELKVVPKSFHYQMSQFVTKAATINFKKKICHWFILQVEVANFVCSVHFLRGLGKQVWWSNLNSFTKVFSPTSHNLLVKLPTPIVETNVKIISLFFSTPFIDMFNF